MDSSLFEEMATVYLITQVGITEMRNANRMILKYFARRDDNLQIVLNRFKASDLVFDESQINKALTIHARGVIAMPVPSEGSRFKSANARLHART